VRNAFRPAHRAAYRARAGLRPCARVPHRVAARLRPGMRYWSRPPNQVQPLCAMVKQILKFHESQPLLISDRMQSENHTDFGQFRTDSVSPNSHLAPNHTDFGHFRTDSTINHQPSTINSLDLWQRQPNEPAADYQLFTGWLELPAPRRFARTAATLGCSVYRLRRLAARHDWRSRAAAFDNHRADASSRALEQLLQQETMDWKERAEQFRLQEWALHEEILQAASAAAREVRQHPNRVSLHGLVKLLGLASTLGRRATGMPLDNVPPKPEPPAPHLNFEEALRKVYGTPPGPARMPEDQEST